jgi:hypothetical protein
MRKKDWKERGVEQRRFIKELFCVLAIAGLLFLGGCEKAEEPERFGNQEKLWHMVSEQQEITEPLDLPYSKETPALYRDASMGKADPSFVPLVGGG